LEGSSFIDLLDPFYFMSKQYKENYRAIWKKEFGDIPKDEYGRSYDIHHKDGNKSNNTVNNLIAVSIEDHFKIHLEQKEFAACKAISLRMNIDFSGWHHSFESKEKIRQHHLSLGDKFWTKREDVKLKISKSVSKEKNPNYKKYGDLHHNFGKKWILSEEQCNNRRGSNNPRARSINQLSPSGNIIKTFECIKDAAEYFKVTSAAILRSTKNLNAKCKGFYFRYT